MLDRNYNYCFIDFETTGLSHDRDDIIQVGCIITNADLQIISHFSSFINPGYDIDKLKTIVSYTTGISPEQIMGGISLAAFLDEIMALIHASDKPLVFVGQNIQFDIKFLKKYLSDPAYGNRGKEGNVDVWGWGNIDTLDRAKVFIHYPASYSLDILYPIVRENIGSDYFINLAKQVERDDITNHDALSDCLICIGLMHYYKQKIIGICSSFPVAKSIIAKSDLPYVEVDFNNLIASGPGNLTTSKVPLLDFPIKPEASSIVDRSFPRSEYGSGTKFFYGNMPIEQFVRKISGLGKVIIATNSRQKLSMIKTKCKLMGLHDMSFVKEQQQVNKEKLNAIYTKPKLDSGEGWFFLKYCSHKLQGLGLLDLNTPSDYKIYNYIRDDIATKKSNIMLATHAALFSLIENAEYKDYTICFLDNEWRYTSFLKYRSSPRDPVNFPRIIDNYMYKYDHDAKITSAQGLRIIMNSLDFFVSYLFAETAAYIKGIKQQKDGRYELGVISGSRHFPKTNGIYEEVARLLNYDNNGGNESHDENISGLSDIDIEDREVILKQFEKLQSIMENISFAAVSGYNSDAFLYTIGNNFVEYHEFMHLFSDYSVFFFSNSNETFQYITKKEEVGVGNIVSELQNITDKKEGSGNMITRRKIEEISTIEELQNLDLMNKIFIINNNPIKAKKIFEYLQSHALGKSYKVLVENVTGGRGKNLALSKNHEQWIMVGGYDFIMQCISEKIGIEQVIMYEQLGLLHSQIMGDVKYWMGDI